MHRMNGMSGTSWFLLVGGLLVLMALIGTTFKRLPFSSSLLYLLVGVALGRLDVAFLSPVLHEELLHRAAEVAVIVSLFTAGLKLRARWCWDDWNVPVRLAVVAMVLTAGLIALTGLTLLGLSLGAAVLLAGVLAPTDPVLASDVQVEKPGDKDPLRFGLTGEAGLNDGMAFPIVMLGLGLLGVHPLGDGGVRWWLVDLLWAVPAGLAVGYGLGLLVGRLVLYLRTKHREALGLDDFLALGLIALSYGVALSVKAYGFLAVFSAGLALRRVEARKTGDAAVPEEREQPPLAPDDDLATHPEHAPGYLAKAVLGFNEQLERLAEFFLMGLVGILLARSPPPPEALWFVPLVLLVLRPLAVWPSLVGAPLTRLQKGLIAFFGIRGIGSLYYLFFAATHGLSPALTRELGALVLSVIAASVALHGVSVTPLMNRYRRKREGSGPRQGQREHEGRRAPDAEGPANAPQSA